jgi:hypothetical protein
MDAPEEKKDDSYLHGQPEKWADAVFRPVADSPGGPYVRITGECPQCKHDISKSIVPRTGAVALAAEKGDVDEKSFRYLVTCNCIRGHADAPDGVRGCGAQGWVAVKSKKGAISEVVAIGDSDPDEWDKDEYVELMLHQQLPKLREFAGQWTAMLGVVTGFLAVGTFFDFTLEDLKIDDLAWKVYVAGAAVALVAAVIAVALGSQAAGLRQFDEMPADTAGRVKALNDTVEYCRRRLDLSKIAALVSVVSLGIAMAARFAG